MPNLELESIWSGATWRTFPPPMIAKPEPRAQTPEACMARLVNVLTNAWQSRSAIRDRAEMEPARVTEYLHRLVEQGRVERLTQPAHTQSRRGRPQHFYRLVTR